jgi:anti-repressor protein
MSNLIQIKETNGKQAVSAKELYIGLGLNKINWARWSNSNIINNDFFAENEHWVGVLHNEEGNETIDYAISIEFAKHIAMMARTEKSHEYRNYFLECEKKVYQPQLPTTYKEALQELLVKVEENEKLQLTNTTLSNENNILTKQNLTWADRHLINAIIRRIGGQFNYETAWRDFKKELLYNYSINLNSRITNHMNATGKKTKPKTLDMIIDDELQDCLATAVSLARYSNVDISDLLKQVA